MSYKFNPLTGTLDYFESASASSLTFYKTEKIVDAAFLLNKEITLTVEPLADGEFVFLNGLLMGDDCYSIVGTTLTFVPTLPFKVGHIIIIRYAA